VLFVTFYEAAVSNQIPLALPPSSAGVRVIRERAPFTQPRALAVVDAASQRRRRRRAPSPFYTCSS
jgi:hypothetical protein